MLLLDDHAIFREALRSLLALDPAIEVVGEAANGWEALRLVGTLRPSLVLTDLSLPGLHGVEVIREMKRLQPGLTILVLTVHATDTFVRASLQAGAAGYVVKEASYDELKFAIHSVMKGRSYVSPSVANTVVHSYLHDGRISGNGGPLWEKLTKREREVLKLVAEGTKNKAIADCLCISVKTVEKHRASLMSKLDLHSAAALTTFAIEHGLIATSEFLDRTEEDQGGSGP